MATQRRPGAEHEVDGASGVGAELTEAKLHVLLHERVLEGEGGC
jgi:hypothetical protein